MVLTEGKSIGKIEKVIEAQNRVHEVFIEAIINAATRGARKLLRRAEDNFEGKAIKMNKKRMKSGEFD